MVLHVHATSQGVGQGYVHSKMAIQIFHLHYWRAGIKQNRHLLFCFVGDLNKHLGTTFPKMNCLPPIAKWLVTPSHEGEGSGIVMYTLTCAQHNYSCAQIRLQEGSLTPTIKLIYMLAGMKPEQLQVVSGIISGRDVSLLCLLASGRACASHASLQCSTEYYQLANL